jgi:hypothetical protein
VTITHLFASAKADGADATIVQPGDWNDPHVIGASTISRTMQDATGKGWQFLGSATGATTTVGPIVWTGTFTQIEFYYFIAGYNGGTPVGRLLVGGAAINTTGATNGSRLREGVGTENVTPVSVPGMPLAVTLSNIPRNGKGWIDGPSGGLKRIRVNGGNGAPSVTVPMTLFEGISAFSDLSTNLPLQRAQLTCYDTLVATAVSAQTFTAGTYLMVLGRNTD